MSLSVQPAAIDDIIAAGRFIETRGWAPATSGNYSVRLADHTLLMTVSGRDKGALTPDDLMPLTPEGDPLNPHDPRKPSAETLLHVGIYRRRPDVNAILHTHSVPGVVLSRHLKTASALILSEYEILKALPGITTHETTLTLPIFENTQDMTALSQLADSLLAEDPAMPGYLIRGHGLYAWGCSMAEARRVLEALEFMISCEIAALSL